MTKAPMPKKFEFLSPLDGETYTLPPFDKSLIFQAMEGHEDELEPIPPASVFYSKKFTPQSRRDFLANNQAKLSEFMLTTALETFDAHLPEEDDPAKAAIIALMDARQFPAVFKIYNEWFEAYVDEQVESPGEG